MRFLAILGRVETLVIIALISLGSLSQATEIRSFNDIVDNSERLDLRNRTACPNGQSALKIDGVEYPVDQFQIEPWLDKSGKIESRRFKIITFRQNYIFAIVNVDFSTDDRVQFFADPSDPILFFEASGAIEYGPDHIHYGQKIHLSCSGGLP